MVPSKPIKVAGLVVTFGVLALVSPVRSGAEARCVQECTSVGERQCVRKTVHVCVWHKHLSSLDSTG